MFNTEESQTSAFILFTFALLLLALVFDMYVLAGTAVILVAMLVFIVFARFYNRSVGRQPDERSALCSLSAARNGFVVAIVSLALLTVAAQVKLLPLVMMDVLSIVWGVSVVTYLVTYQYYKNRVLGDRGANHA